MLTFQPAMPGAYSPYLTVASYLACMILIFTSFVCRSRVIGALATTGGVATMHLIGLTALQTAGRMEHD